nr:ABC transporter permease [uncultured Subdoligranulum sp.]
MARRRENSIFRAVGLTQRQLYQMIVCEGLCYALTAAMMTLLVGVPVSLLACRAVSAMTYGGKIVAYRFPFLEMGLFLLALFGLELILSLWTIRRQKKCSLIEEMRALE